MDVQYKILSFNDGYRVGSDGSVWSRRRPGGGTGEWRTMKQYVDWLGYSRVELFSDGKSKKYKVHRLVLFEFVGNPLPGQEGCHNNGIKADNRPENLRWDYHKNNLQDAIDAGNWPKQKGKEVLQKGADGKIIRQWPSILEAATSLNIWRQNIAHCCHGRIKSTGGSRWEFAK